MSRILIVDDNEIIRNLLRLVLEEAGYEVVEAIDGLKAFKFHNKKPADLIITDINMPVKNGLELIAELKMQDPDLKIIAISGDNDQDLSTTLKTAQKLGAAYAFAKPFDTQEVVKAVKELIG
ncbi:response regulator [bacterium]|nr:MAG: response regulator [bacterium]